MRNPDWTTITETATKVGRYWNNKHVVAFHYFNKHGLYARWKRNNDAISQLVEEGVVPSGWLLAYGDFADYSAKRLTNDLFKKQRVGSRELYVCLKMLQEDCENQEAKIEEARAKRAA